MLLEDKREILEVLFSNRLFLYSLFHKVFGREPDEDLLAVLTRDETGQAFALLSEEPDDVMDRAVRFLAQLRQDCASPEFIDRVKNEYTRLFIGPAKLAAPPWESVYRSKQGLLFQESTLAVREFYRKFGLLPEGYPHVADDSLALELHFMAKLSERALEALHADDQSSLIHLLTGQNIFLQNHLLVWVPKFLERMAEAPSDHLYPQLCLILDSFLKKDQEMVEEMLETIRQ